MLRDAGSPERPSPDELVRAAGAIAYDCQLEGVLGLADSHRDVVWVEESLPATRRSFVLLHEVGHLWLGPGASEAACQRFAAAALMPAWRLRRDVLELGLDLPRLAGRWPACSWDAIARRCAELLEGVAAGHIEAGVWRWWVGSLDARPATAYVSSLACGISSGRSMERVAGWWGKAWRRTPRPQRALTLASRSSSVFSPSIEEEKQEEVG